jgi:hypothetical protein
MCQRTARTESSIILPAIDSRRYEFSANLDDVWISDPKAPRPMTRMVPPHIGHRAISMFKLAVH